MSGSTSNGQSSERNIQRTQVFARTFNISADAFPFGSVVSVYTDDDSGFVRHLALLAAPTDLPSGEDVEVWHMGPPLAAGEISLESLGHLPTCRVDIVSDPGLTPREQNYLRSWLATVDKERRPGRPFQQYVIRPHMKWQHSETGRPLYRRFSCVGFVLEAYKAAEFGILDESGRYPAVDESLLVVAYPDLARIENANPRVRARLGFVSREDLGLAGEGPWPLILPGYVFHALARLSETKPRPARYNPASVDEMNFP